MTILEKVARAICKAEGCFPWEHLLIASQEGSRNTATAAINVFLAAAAEEGWHMVRDEATEEMLRAWVAAKIDGIPGKDPDEMVPVPGTGQGDLQFHEFWRDVVESLSLKARIKAALDAAPEFEWDK